MNDTDSEKDYVVIYEAPKIEPPEFRLYYDEETGKVLCYTCEKIEGKYIVIDQVTYAIARPDLRVVNGKIVTAVNVAVINKLVPDTEGTSCLKEDISILSNTGVNANTKYWKLKLYESH